MLPSVLPRGRLCHGAAGNPGEYLRAARRLQCIHLQGDGLVAGADTAIAKDHERSFRNDTAAFYILTIVE